MSYAENWIYPFFIGKIMNERQEKQFRKLKKIIEQKGGKCLSNTYINNITKLKFQCEKGHIWNTTFSSIVNDRYWCSVCNINRQKNNIDNITKIIQSKNGKLLTKEYKNNKHKLKIQCSNGHIWDSSYSVIKKGHWCPNCAFISSRLTKKEKLKGFNFIFNTAKEKGGKCLSHLEKYKNIVSKLKFQCFKGHKWNTTASSIKNGKWCHICCQSLSEKLFRCVLEKVFNQSFPSIRPSWLKSDKNYPLEIDGYNKKLKFGFEHQGKQHFKFSSFFHKTEENFKRRLLNDSLKASILKEKNIFMLYPTYELKKENYFNFIKDKIKNTPYFSLANFNQKIDINELYKYI